MEIFTSSFKQSSFLQAVLESLIDGVLILTDQGEWIHANQCARQICHRLTEGMAQTDRVPQQIWHVCESLIGSLKLYPNKTIVIEDEIIADDAAHYRLRAQWVKLDATQRPCLLVTLEDRLQSLRDVAIAESNRYRLTTREADVWLRHRTHHTYKEIATALYITQNTVKKHMKNIHAKRQQVLDEGRSSVSVLMAV